MTRTGSARLAPSEALQLAFRQNPTGTTRSNMTVRSTANATKSRICSAGSRTGDAFIPATTDALTHSCPQSASPPSSSSGYNQWVLTLEDPYSGMVSGLRFIDCNTLSGLKIPLLKTVAAYIADRDPTLKLLSPQKISDALRKFGIRVPTGRPRRNSRRTPAAI